jgi:hypothetical protein
LGGGFAPVYDLKVEYFSNPVKYNLCIKILVCWLLSLSPMRILKDPVFLVLAGVLAMLLILFFLGAIPYPYGMLILLAFIMARIL